MSCLVHFERDHRPDQNQPVHHNPAVEQGPELHLQPQPLQRHHVGRVRARHIGKRDIVRLERQHRQHRQPDRPGDLELAPRRLFNQRGDARAINLDRDGERKDHRRGDEENDDHPQADQQFPHRAPPGGWFPQRRPPPQPI
jgi:hypothetical protein